MNKRYTIIVLLFINCYVLSGQKGSVNYGITLQISRLAVHSPKLKFVPAGFGGAIDFSISKNIKGNDYWQRIYHYPLYGVIFKYMHLGAPRESLGYALVISPFYEFTIHTNKYYSSHFVVCSGLSYNSKKYDPLYNPLQNAISTSWNNHTSFEWKLKFNASKRFNLYTGISLTHISNGSFKSPNLGLNYINLLVSIQHKGIIHREEKDIVIPRLKKNLFSANYGIAFREHKIPGGPKFKVYNLNVEYGRMYSAYKFIKFGFDMEQHTLSAYFAERSEVKSNIKMGFNLSLRMHVFAGHEWELGRTNLETRIGYQMLNNILLEGVPLYAKMIFQYHLPVFKVPNVKISLGICLKAQYGNAEYISAIAGLRYKF